jgi:hypothetical protein
MKILPLVLTLSGVLLSTAWAEDPVHFEDPALKAAVEEALWISDPTPSDMLALTNLSCSNSDITSLVGLEYAKNLHDLSAMENDFTDLSPLAGLTDLRDLNIQDNDIDDISALSGLVNLEVLNMEDTFVTDLSPLVGLMSLRFLDMRNVPLDDDSYEDDIPQIIADNPGIEILHDRAEFHLILFSGPGGSIVSPGEGDFVYEGATCVSVEAKADPGFVFAGFSGSISSMQNPFSFTFDHDFDIEAHFVSVLSVIHVDDNAPADPGPGNPAVSDPKEDGTSEHPFDLIEDAVEVARNGSTVFVHAGTYYETIDLLGKRITLTGFDPADANAMAWPTIDGNGAGPVVSFTHGESSDCRLSGLVLTGGDNRIAAAIYSSRSSPTIANCLIVGNQATDRTGAVVYCTGSSASFVNCTIADSSAGTQAAALYSADGQVTVVNSIFWGNTPRPILTSGTGGVSVSYSLVSGGPQGIGNINADPLFAHASYWTSLGGPGAPDAVWTPGDYHVQSQTGRWDPVAGKWVQDSVTSPCIDAGDPAGPIGAELVPNGGIVNMGAYGGTAEASKSRPGVSSL